MKFLSFIFSILIFLSSNLKSEDLDSSIWQWGYECGYVLEAFDEEDTLQIQIYRIIVQGYISGMNKAYTTMVGKDVSEQTIKYSLEKYCRDNPTKTTAEASVEIYQILLDE